MPKNYLVYEKLSIFLKNLLTKLLKAGLLSKKVIKYLISTISNSISF